MMRSMWSAVAGLKTHQLEMDVIGNNIANVNTTAYKSQATGFQDVLYQTVKEGTGAGQKAHGGEKRGEYRLSDRGEEPACLCGYGCTYESAHRGRQYHRFCSCGL